MEWRGLFCTADLHAHFFSPPLSPRTEHCGGRRQEQLGLFRGKSSSSSMRRSRCPTAYIRPFLPPTTIRNHQHHHHQKPPVPPPPSETTSSTSTNSSTTRTTIISTNSKPSVTSSSLWAIYTCWHPMLDVPYSLLLSIECRKFTG